MSITPEYGEELLMEDREDEEREDVARGSLPVFEDMAEAEVLEQERAEEETHHPALENHEAHMPGAVCDHCGAVIAEHDDVRLTVNGRWVHEVCPGTV